MPVVMRWFDIPPVWLIGFIALSWGLSYLAQGSGFGAFSGLVGVVLLILAAAITVLAVREFKKAGTTIIPGQEPSALVTSGVFAFSRNPIYLADVMFLTGPVLIWDAVLALPLIAVFIWVLRTRFIAGEEARLEAAYPAEFAAYCAATRRWI